MFDNNMFDDDDDDDDDNNAAEMRRMEAGNAEEDVQPGEEGQQPVLHNETAVKPHEIFIVYFGLKRVPFSQFGLINSFCCILGPNRPLNKVLFSGRFGLLITLNRPLYHTTNFIVVFYPLWPY